MKKIIALLLVAVMAMGVFAACGKDSGNDTPTHAEGFENMQTPEAAGSLLINAAATLSITYGADGLVLNMEGINDDGVELVQMYAEEHFGSSCTDVVNQVVIDCVQKNYMFDTNYVVIKQNKGSALPGTNFLDSVESAAQRALDTVESKAALVLITEENVSEEGYIDLVTTKVLVEKYLGIEKLDGFDGTDKPIDGMYAFDVTYDDMEERVSVDAITGAVSQGVITELEQAIEQEMLEGITAEDMTPTEELLAQGTEPTDDNVEIPEDTVAAEN